MDNWGTFVTGLSGFAFFGAAILALVIRKWRWARYLAITGYALLWPIHLWFWQFELTDRTPLPHWYFWSAAQQIAIGGIGPLIWYCFRRFRPGFTALYLAYVLSLELQLFSYMYWSYGTTKGFSAPLSHLDAIYFALGTLTTAGTGNISAISETTRRLQALQMGLDLVLFGFVIALILARYSNLFSQPQAKSAAGNTTAARSNPVAVESGTQPQQAGEPNPYSDHQTTVPGNSERDGQGTRSAASDRRILEPAPPVAADESCGDTSTRPVGQPDSAPPT